jgi:signal recognition particle subunit SRP54
MVLDTLGSALKNTLAKIAKSMFVDEKLINELVKDIQRALLKSDVNVKLVFELSESIKKKALDEKPLAGMSQKEFLIKIVYDELVKFLGGEGHKIDITKKPFKIMLVGLFGSGKTTTTGKLAKFFQKRGYKIAVMSTDTWRPAAFEQLNTLGKSLNIPVFGNPKQKDPIKIYKEFEKELDKFDIVIVDTAGRDALSKDLIKEITKLGKLVNADESLLVISGDIGQAAQAQAQAFHEAVGVTGLIATKMEGTARGGGALAGAAITNAPIKFLGVGEKIEDLEPFDPKRFVSLLLGMGDIETLLEKAQEAMTEEDAEDMKDKLMKGKFSLMDLYDQMSAMKKMGPLSKVAEMIPGFGNMKIPGGMMDAQEDKLKVWKTVMDSMTKKELDDPDLLNISRIERIAKGAGVTVKDVRELIKQYRQSKKLIKMMKGQDPMKMMKKMKGKIPGM